MALPPFLPEPTNIPKPGSSADAGRSSKIKPRVAARLLSGKPSLRDPDDRLANYRLGQTLQELHEPELSIPFLKQSGARAASGDCAGRTVL